MKITGNDYEYYTLTYSMVKLIDHSQCVLDLRSFSIINFSTSYKYILPYPFNLEGI